MGWFRNVFKSLSDAGGEISGAEATDAELKAFLKKAGENASSARVDELEQGLQDKKNLLKRLETEKIEPAKIEKIIKRKATKQEEKEEER